MNPSAWTEPRPEAMADVPGGCELPLTRAVVGYRDVHELDVEGGRIQDIGLGLVVEGRYASSAEVLDLGSAELKMLDLSAELVILDWVYEPTLEHVAELIRRRAAGGRPAEPGGEPEREGAVGREGEEELGAYAFRLALQILVRLGFGPLTRPTLLRIGFRDVCRDLDLHEGTSVRIVLGPGRLTRCHMDYDACALVFRTADTVADPGLEEALLHAFPGGDLRRLVPVHDGRGISYQVRFPLPLQLAEARSVLGGVRRGLEHLLARFEPSRYRSVEGITRTFGVRDTLATLHRQEPRTRAEPLVIGARPGPGPLVH